MPLAKSVAELPLITQAALRSFRKLSDERRHTEAAYSAMRDSLMARLSKGSPIQDGKLTAFVVTSAQTRFSFEAVAAVKGERFAAKLRAELPETISHSVKVEEVEPA